MEASLIIPQNDKLMTRHIRPLYIKVNINSMEMKRVLIDNEDGVNIMPLATLKKFSIDVKDLEKIDVFMTNFVRHD